MRGTRCLFREFRFLCFVLAFASFCMGTFAQNYNTSKLSTIGGEVFSVDVQGDLAFLGEGSFLTVVDISDISSPREISRVELPDRALDVLAVGSLVYVANDYRGGLQVVDVSDPAKPFIKSKMSLPGGWDANGLALLSPSLLLVSRTMNGLVVDVSNPAAPKVIGTTEPSSIGYYETVASSGTLAVFGGSTGFKIFDVSAPTSPVLLNTTPSSSWVRVAISGSKLVTSGRIGFSVYDISKPTTPTLLATQGGYLGYDTRDVAIQGNYVYTGGNGHNYDGLHGFEVFDINDLSSLSLKASLESSYVSEIRLDGSRAFFADRFEGMKILDISDPTTPTLMGLFPTVGPPGKVIEDFPYVYASDGASGIKIVKVADPRAPKLIGTYQTLGNPHRLEQVGDLLYIPVDEQGLEIVDVSQKEKPVYVGSIENQRHGHACFAKLVGKTAFVSIDEIGVNVVDVSSPAKPRLISTIAPTMFPAPNQVQVVSTLDVNRTQANQIYFTDYYSGLQLYDVSSLSKPVNVPLRSVMMGLQYISVVDNLTTENPKLLFATAYTTENTNERGLKIFDITDPTSPVLLSYSTYWGDPGDVTVSKGYAYVGGGTGGIYVFDVANPASPTQSGWYRSPGQAIGLDVHGSMAYVADSIGGLALYRLSGGRIKDAEILGHTIPDEIPAGKTITAEVTVRNYGRSAWQEAIDVALSVPKDPALMFGALRPKWDMPPDQKVLLEGDYTFDVDITAPNKEGDYSFDLQMAEKNTSAPMAASPRRGFVSAAMISSALEFFGQELTVNIQVVGSVNAAKSWGEYK